MSKRWVTRAYTYREPVDEPISEYQPGVTGPDTYSDTILYPGANADFDAGWNAGYRAGWVAGYGSARYSDGQVNPDDLAEQEGG